MSEPVSVIITCYNLERFIGEAIHSVKEQSYKGDVQIVVVDDYSTDQSLKILADIPGIEVVQQVKNGGVMQAMIAGLRAAKHDMVFFIDGDDVWHREKLSRCMEQVTADTVLCTHDLWYMSSKGKPLTRRSRVTDVLGQADTRDLSGLIKIGILEHADYVWLGSAFGVSRSRGGVDAFIEFCEQRDYLNTCYQDWPLATWVALEPGGSFAFANEQLFGYRLHSENYSGSSQTLEKLRRNLTKARDTMRLIEEIIVAKHGSAATARHYRRARAQYEIMLASTLVNRKHLALLVLRSLRQFSTDARSIKIAIRVALALLLGPERAHSAIERMKS